MAITRQKKEEILKNIEDKGKKSASAIFVNFHGLNVAGETELRSNLRNSGVDYVVAKKTLIRKAFDTFKLKGEMPELDGEVAIAFGKEDAVAPAREVFEFGKKHKDMVTMLGGMLEGEYIDANKALMLANIPSREVLYGKFVNVINSPIQGMVVTLNGVMRNFVSVLSQIKK